MSSWSIPSPETPIAPINVPPRYMGTPPGKIWIPLAAEMRGLQGAEGTTPRLATILSMTRSSCSPVENGLQKSYGFESGPGPLPLSPSGKNGRARLPTARLL